MRALISIGTNSTRLLVQDAERRVAAESRGTRIGTGIGATGALDPAARARTLEAIDAYVALARDAGAGEIDAIATSALRRAGDADGFGADVERRVGIAPRILSGDEEATYSFLGATRTRDGALPLGVLDVGGGSSELAVDTPAHARAQGTVGTTHSVEIGAVRLAERHRALLGGHALLGAERAAVERSARDDAAALLQPFASAAGIAELIVVGGTAFTAAAMAAGGLHDGAVLARADVAALIDALFAHDLDGRRSLPFIRPQRADILPAGLLVIDEACRLLRIDRFTVSEADLLLGYLSSPAFRSVAVAGR